VQFAAVLGGLSGAAETVEQLTLKLRRTLQQISTAADNWRAIFLYVSPIARTRPRASTIWHPRPASMTMRVELELGKLRNLGRRSMKSSAMCRATPACRPAVDFDNLRERKSAHAPHQLMGVAIGERTIGSIRVVLRLAQCSFSDSARPLPPSTETPAGRSVDRPFGSTSVATVSYG
jgi:hypothetical protein